MGGKTSTAAKYRWNKENYKQYFVSFRKDTDAELIAFVEEKKESGLQTTEIFRDAIQKLKDED